MKHIGRKTNNEDIATQSDVPNITSTDVTITEVD